MYNTRIQSGKQEVMGYSARAKGVVYSGRHTALDEERKEKKTHRIIVEETNKIDDICLGHTCHLVNITKN